MPPRILVADDDRALQVLLNVLLSRAGYSVEFANDGRQALQKMQADAYDVVMLDLILPEVSGIELLEHIERENPEALRKVIVLTGASRGVIDRIDGTKVRAIVRKPFDIHDVIRLTAQCVYEE